MDESKSTGGIGAVQDGQPLTIGLPRALRASDRLRDHGFDASEEGKEDDAGEFDIDFSSADSGYDESSVSASPLRRQMSLLGM